MKNPITRLRALRKPKKTAAKTAGYTRVEERYTPPEGVPIGLELASIGTRLGAVILDILITWLTIIAIFFLLVWVNILNESAFFTLFILLVFFAGVPYYVLSELIWNGRTLGKRITKIQVVSSDGRSLQPHQVVTRNLMKEVEFFTPVRLLLGIEAMSWAMVIITLLWVALVVILLIRSRRKQRLGDLAAGTLVVERPKAVLLQDLAIGQAVSRFTFDMAQLDIYGRYELQTLETILRDGAKNPVQKAEWVKVAQTIAKRITYPEVIAEQDAKAFLLAFYRAQRERLESRQLFGDKRDDKFYAAEAADGSKNTAA